MHKKGYPSNFSVELKSKNLNPFCRVLLRYEFIFVSAYITSAWFFSDIFYIKPKNDGGFSFFFILDLKIITNNEKTYINFQ